MKRPIIGTIFILIAGAILMVLAEAFEKGLDLEPRRLHVAVGLLIGFLWTYLYGPRHDVDGAKEAKFRRETEDLRKRSED
jgi:uncharacterized BrkB/YihY/UPF0761 family membrane protein